MNQLFLEIWRWIAAMPAAYHPFILILLGYVVVGFMRKRGWINGNADLVGKVAHLTMMLNNHCSGMEAALERNTQQTMRNTEQLQLAVTISRDAQEQMNRVANSMNVILTKQDELMIELVRLETRR